MIHPATQVVHVSDVVGDGVVATELIPQGTIVWTQDSLDRVFSAESLPLLPDQVLRALERYAHIDERGRYVLCWDAGKLINHSCEPTLRGVGTWFQVARRNILPGEELTCDYAECNIRQALNCTCPVASCRGSVVGGDLLRFADQWDAEAISLLGLLRAVSQPLWPYLLRPEEVDDFLLSRQPLPSFRTLHAGES